MCSQDLAKGGGLFWKLERTVNELDPNFHQSWIRLRRFFCQSQVISKKKIFTKIQTVFPAKIRRSPKKKLGDLQKTKQKYFCSPIPFWGTVSIFGAQIGLKTLKTYYFAYCSGQWGCSPPPAPFLATLLNCPCLIFSTSLPMFNILYVWVSSKLCDQRGLHLLFKVSSFVKMLLYGTNCLLWSNKHTFSKANFVLNPINHLSAYIFQNLVWKHRNSLHEHHALHILHYNLKSVQKTITAKDNHNKK